MGAWIEIYLILVRTSLLKSHPTWVRGLKFLADEAHHINAWSHPTRVRGLKFTKLVGKNLSKTSHPTRVRGLKL